MSDEEDEDFATVRRWVWSGFYSVDEIQEMIGDILEEESDEKSLRASVGKEIKRKVKAEKAWPKVTECDRLDEAFAELHALGICALHNAGYTMSDGHEDVAEAIAGKPKGTYFGYCFYHGQDVERAVDGGGLMLAFGHVSDQPKPGVEVGQAIVAVLTAKDFKVEWDQSIESRIDLPAMVWQRRSKVE